MTRPPITKEVVDFVNWILHDMHAQCAYYTEIANKIMDDPKYRIDLDDHMNRAIDQLSDMSLALSNYATGLSYLLYEHENPPKDLTG